MTTPNSSVSAYDTKLTRAESIITEFNKTSHQIPDGDFIPKIKSLGGISEEALSFFEEKDLTDALPAIPKIIARQIISIFREKGEKTKEDKPAWISPRMVDRMNYEQLLGHYNPEESNTVSNKLKELGKNKAFIVFLPHGGIDVETSVKLLKEIRTGFGERPKRLIEVNGQYVTIHEVGENPDRYADANPLFKGRPLRPDGTCDQTNRSWEGISHNVRELLWIAVNTSKELVPTLNVAHEILDLCVGDPEKAHSRLCARYQQAAAIQTGLEKTQNKPYMKIQLGKASATSQENNPFLKQ